MATTITRRGGIIIGIIGALVLGGGIAVAAFLLSTPITGQTRIDTTTTANTISIVGTNDPSGLDCSNTTGNAAGITVDVLLHKQVAGPNVVNPTPQATASCVITATVKNTGDTALTAGTPDFVLPTGFTIADNGSTGFQNLAPGATGTISVKISADPAAAVAAPITGKLTFTSA